MQGMVTKWLVRIQFVSAPLLRDVFLSPAAAATAVSLRELLDNFICALE